MRWVLFLFLFGLGFPASVVYDAKLQMPKVDNDDVVRYLNYLYEKSLALSDSLEILERMWQKTLEAEGKLDDFRASKQAYQTALSDFASAKQRYIDFIQNPRSYSTLQPATDLQAKLRDLVLRQLELKQSIEVISPALRALYPDLFYTSQAVNNTRVFNRLVSGFLSSVSEIAKLGLRVLFNPLLEFGYVDLLEGQLSFLRYLLYLQWRSVQHSGLGIDFIVPSGFNPSLLPDFSQLPWIGSPCYYTVSVSSRCYEVQAICANGRVVGYRYVPLMDWSPYSAGNLFRVPTGILITDVPRHPLYPWAWEYSPDGLAWVFHSYYFYYLDATISIPVRTDSPVYYFNPYPIDEYFVVNPKREAYRSPGYWHYVYDPCIVCTCQIRLVLLVDNCFNFRAPSTSGGFCSCRRVCRFDVENPATHPQEIPLPAPSPSVRPSPSPSPFPLPLGDPLPKIEVSPEVLPQLDPDTLIQPFPIPSPQRFIVRPSVRPDVEVPPGVDFEFPPDPEIGIIVDLSPENELIPAINWIISEEIASALPMTDTLVDALEDVSNSDRCREQEQMLYANFDGLRDLIFYSFVGLASLFGFISALLVSMSIFELWKNIPIRRV
jgi:hypothetical protein